MNKEIEIKLHVTDYLDKAFQIIPSNAILHKGRCGIGGTTLEILAERSSILTVPTNGVITSKCLKHSELFAVNGDVTVDKIEQYLTSEVCYKKIINTPDSFWKIINAAFNVGKLGELYDTYFLLMDESHTAITDAYRERILYPFQWLWNFKAKTFVSATPFDFSDERFQSLTRYRITFHEPYIGTIKVRHTTNVSGCVDWYIKNRQVDSKLFFFLTLWLKLLNQCPAMD